MIVHDALSLLCGQSLDIITLPLSLFLTSVYDYIQYSFTLLWLVACLNT